MSIFLPFGFIGGASLGIRVEPVTKQESSEALTEIQVLEPSYAPPDDDDEEDKLEKIKRAAEAPPVSVKQEEVV